MSEKIEISCEPELLTVCRLLGGGRQTGQLEGVYASERKALSGLVKPLALIGRLSPDTQAAEACELIPGGAYLAVLLTLGADGSRYVEALFKSGEHLRGLVADAVQSAWLFAADERLKEQLFLRCQTRGEGVAERLEAPRELPIAAQKMICESLDADMQLGVYVNGGGMLKPEKSMCYLLRLCGDGGRFAAGHDCGRCERKDCGMRKETPELIELVVEDQGKKITCAAGTVLMEALRAGGVRVSAPCGGTARCGKCRVRVVKGALPMTAADRALLSGRELESGVRLACAARPEESLRLRLLDKPERRIAATAQLSSGAGGFAHNAFGAAGCGVAVDIGTTTLAACLYDLADGQVCGTVTAVNSGRDYGADVLSRMEASNNGKKTRLQELLQEDVRGLLAALLERTGADKKAVKKIVIAANMTMVHLLLGYSCETLAKAPFTPVNKGFVRADALRLLGDPSFACPVEVLPAVSAFVGGDIVAGMLACGMDQGEETALLLDVGTNGEMALRHRGSVLVTSAAAGPAFEGGGIRCGCASVPGAVSGVRISDRDFIPKLTTIDGAALRGICGSGVLELAGELLRTGLVDETGLFAQAYRQDGFLLGRTPEGERVCLTQADIRQLQLAKGAIRAGLETLLAKAGVSAGDVRQVYLAGGFGVRMDEAAAIRIGLLPQAFAGRIRAVGNSSLSGARLFGAELSAERLPALLAQCREVVLAGDAQFEERYVKYMNFGENI